MLRKLAFIVPILFVNILTYGQIKKGDRMFGASVGTIFFNNGSTDYSTSIGTSTTSTDNFGITINPLIGKFINDNVVLGIMPDIGYNKQKQLGKSSAGSTYLKDETSQYNVGIGGFARYYFDGKNDKMRVFGQYNLSIGLGGSKTSGFQYETLGIYVDRYDRKSSGDIHAKTGVTLGVSKFFNNHTALDFYIGYNFSYIKSNPEGTTIRDYSNPATADETQKINYDQKFTGNNVVVGVGFQVFLEKRK